MDEFVMNMVIYHFNNQNCNSLRAALNGPGSSTYIYIKICCLYITVSKVYPQRYKEKCFTIKTNMTARLI